MLEINFLVFLFKISFVSIKMQKNLMQFIYGSDMLQLTFNSNKNSTSIAAHISCCCC